MSTLNIKPSRAISHSRYENILRRLRSLEHSDIHAFYSLVRLCRNPELVILVCQQPAAKCKLKHPHCHRLPDYLGLVVSIDDSGRAEIDPAVRRIVLAATPAAQMPKLISPIPEAVF